MDWPSLAIETAPSMDDTMVIQPGPPIAAPPSAAMSIAALAGTAMADAPQSAASNGYLDGAANAPAGTPSLPTLLNGYAVRPPWQVAGVDYAVGAPAGATLKDPATISMPGVAVSASSHKITITGSNVALDGYDFSLNNGWGVYIKSGASNTVIKNSVFRVGSNQVTPVQAEAGSTNLTLLDNTLDGGSGTNPNFTALVLNLGSGAFVAQYNHFTNAPADAVDFINGTITGTVSYNLFDNLGTAAGSHPDTLQFGGDHVDNFLYSFNTIHQPASGGSGGMQGIQLQAQQGAMLTNTRIENNVVIAKGPILTMSYSIAVIQDSGNTIDGAIVSNNYIDPTGAYGPFYPASGSNLTFTNNVKLTNGTAIQPSSGTFRRTDLGGITALPASGTERFGDTVMITLAMDEPMIVTGTPGLLLNDGAVAQYAGGSGTASLSFRYTVAGTDAKVPALAVTGVQLPAGATIKNFGGNPANLTNAQATFPGLAIDPVQVPTGVTFSPTRRLGETQGGSGLAPKIPVMTVAETGGNPADSFTYALGGSGAAPFRLFTNQAGQPTLVARNAVVAGAADGYLYRLTVTATDTTFNVSSPAIPVDVVVGSSGNDIIQLATLSGAFSTATPTFVFGLGGPDQIDGTGMTGPLWLYAGDGPARLTGGSGVNSYRFANTQESTPGSLQTITNFDASRDMIDLTGLLKVLTIGGQVSGDSLAAGSIAWQFSAGRTYVYVNASAATETVVDADMKIRLLGNIPLSSSNFAHL